MIDPQDRKTWPAGDKLWELAQAIAIAEGYNVKDSNPARLCNPGDLSDGYHMYGGEYHSGSSVTKFPDQETGWKWLRDKLENIFQGKSDVYQTWMTFTDLAKRWSGNWQPWMYNVTRQLGVDEDQTLDDWYSL